jgi:hypothetical protein
MFRRFRTHVPFILVSIALGTPYLGCSSSSPSRTNTDGAVETGGSPGNGGSSGTGGLAGSGGTVGTGGTAGIGGTVGGGGGTGTGGMIATGGRTGGTTAIGGTIATGGRTGGWTGTGGTIATGGRTGAGGTNATGGRTGGGTGTGGTTATGGATAAGGTTSTGGRTGGTTAAGGTTATGGMAGAGGGTGLGGSTGPGGEYGFTYRSPGSQSITCTDSDRTQTFDVQDEDSLCTFHHDSRVDYVYVRASPTGECSRFYVPLYKIDLAQISVDGVVTTLANVQYDFGGNHHNDTVAFAFGGKTYKYGHSSFGYGYRRCQPMDCMVVYAAGSSTTVETDGCTSARTLPEVCVAIEADLTHAALTPDPFKKCPGDPNP